MTRNPHSVKHGHTIGAVHGLKIPCPKCSEVSRVVDTKYRHDINGIVRRRRCKDAACNHQFHTSETVL